MDVLPRDVDQAIQKWNNWAMTCMTEACSNATLVTQELPQSRYAGIKEQHVTLTFVKR